MNTQTRAYRDEYRERWVRPSYRGRWHVLLVAVAGAGMLLAGASQLDRAALAQAWWVVPVTLVVANVVEYLAHRYVMHREVPGLRAMFDRHTRRHHRYFTLGDIELEGEHDLHAVLFPPVLLVFFSAIAVGLSLLVALATSKGVGVLFFLTALGYYLAYEVLHLVAHLPLRRRWPGSAIVARLVAHHRLHHAPEHMGHGNFNIVVPFADWAFGTLRTPAPADQGAAPRSFARDSIAVPAVAHSDNPAPGDPSYQDDGHATGEGGRGESRVVQT